MPAIITGVALVFRAPAAEPAILYPTTTTFQRSTWTLDRFPCISTLAFRAIHVGADGKKQQAQIEPELCADRARRVEALSERSREAGRGSKCRGPSSPVQFQTQLSNRY